MVARSWRGVLQFLAMLHCADPSGAGLLRGAGAAAGPGMQLPKGLSKGLRAGKGPPWRQAIDKVFDEACGMNRGAPSVFCFPDRQGLLSALQVDQFGVDMTGEMYLMDVHVVVQQLLQWPPAWSMIPEVLHPAHPWTGPFCDKIVSGRWWQLVPVVRKGFLSPRHTLVQLQKEAPHVASGMLRWLEAVRHSGNSRTQRLLKEFQASDAADVKNKTVHARPLMRLMQQVHAKAIEHIFVKACKGSATVLAKLENNDTNGLTLLHHVASLGDAAAARAILKSVPKARRPAFASSRDPWGYSAENWARLADFGDTLHVIAAHAGGGASHGAEEPAAANLPVKAVTLFHVVTASGGEGAERSSSAAASCSAAENGGWREPTLEGVPERWLPPAGEPCAMDSIHVAQFDFDVFMHHYVLHPRPLLIRGGGRAPGELSKSYTRAGLLDIAGGHKIDAHRFPTAREYDGSKPMSKTLREYLEFLDERSPKNAAKKLQYVYHRLPKEEVVLNFSASLPEVLAGRVEHLGTQFYLGGLLMGAPPHHHSPAANSLVHGRKLWFLEPPGRELIVHEAMYDYLMRTDGAPGALRCLQEAGDLLYVPRSWTHSAICLGDCVGVSHEFSHKQWDLRD